MKGETRRSKLEKARASALEGGSLVRRLRLGATPKIRVGTADDMTRLKLIWRGSMTEREKDYWRELFLSPKMSQPQIRRHMLAKLKINLEFDVQLRRFREWDVVQQKMDDEQAKAEEYELKLRKEHPDWTKEQVREDLLKRFYNEAWARGDSKLGLRTVTADVRVETLQLNREKSQFDAAKAALKHAGELKAISTSKLTEMEKVNEVRKKLFGVEGG